MWIPNIGGILTCGFQEQGKILTCRYQEQGKILTCGFQEQREFLICGFQGEKETPIWIQGRRGNSDVDHREEKELGCESKEGEGTPYGFQGVEGTPCTFHGR
jgi:hypothetical protein